MVTHHLYVDDSGTREYSDTLKYGKKGKSRYFVYGGILLKQRDAGEVAKRIQDLKVETFETVDVEAKSSWLRNPESRQEKYLDKFGISDAQLTEFTEKFYALIKKAPFECIAAVVDKVHMHERYGDRKHYAPTVAYDVLLQRAVQAMGNGESVFVTIDDISGKTPAHNPYKELLKKHHELLRMKGSPYQPKISFRALAGPVRFQHSHASDLVQVADLVAYNVHRQFRDFGEEWERADDKPRELPTYPYFQRIIGKFRTDSHDRIQGYGIVKFPMHKQVRWTLTKEEKEER